MMADSFAVQVVFAEFVVGVFVLADVFLFTEFAWGGLGGSALASQVN
jgi:hypothetical protein